MSVMSEFIEILIDNKYHLELSPSGQKVYIVDSFDEQVEDIPHLQQMLNIGISLEQIDGCYKQYLREQKLKELGI